jgi:hypothetical protein
MVHSPVLVIPYPVPVEHPIPCPSRAIGRVVHCKVNRGLEAVVKLSRAWEWKRRSYCASRLDCSNDATADPKSGAIDRIPLADDCEIVRIASRTTPPSVCRPVPWLRNTVPTESHTSPAPQSGSNGAVVDRSSTRDIILAAWWHSGLPPCARVANRPESTSPNRPWAFEVCAVPHPNIDTETRPE